MIILSDFNSDTFRIAEYTRVAGERFTVNLRNSDEEFVQGYVPVKLCVTKGVVEMTYADGSVLVRSAPFVTRNWLDNGVGSFEMHTLEDMHGYCAVSKTDELTWVCYLELVKTGIEFTISAFDHPQRLFLCEGNMTEPSGASRSSLFIWTIKPNDTPQFIAETDCVLMRLVGLPNVDEVRGFLAEYPDSSVTGSKT